MLILTRTVSEGIKIAERDSIQVVAMPHIPTDIERRQAVWVDALEWCESQAKLSALNPKDLDNTPSYGAFQFKPGTYATYAKIYKLASTTDYMNGAEQKQIVETMVTDDSVNWEQQFPGCVHLLGRPPKK